MSAEHKEEEKSLVTKTKPPNQLLLVGRGGEAFLCVLHNIVLIPKIRVSSSSSLINLQKKHSIHLKYPTDDLSNFILFVDMEN